MKFYVAGKWQDKLAVQRVQKALADRGHTITVDWTVHTNPMNDSILQEWAIRDTAGVIECDTYIGLFNKNSTGNGSLVEMGMALATGKRVWIIGNTIDSCIFVAHPLVTKFASVKTMLKVLERKPRT